ncbi:DUF4240 domain-containing protein [Sanguibacter sp. 25GB23B1]|uniref:DUF4240 domain-containing protein n=1 Tax=unclassified Sanguibacter TaxID=2645534 RepID=UPI0032AFF857
MDIDTYWTLVEQARERATETDAEAVAAALTEILVERGAPAARGAHSAYSALAAQAYGWPLWGAAYTINGGCSDDGFEYFIGWLVAQGREVFERAVADPDSLADVVDEDTEAEGEDVMAAAWVASTTLTGDDDDGTDHGTTPLPPLGEGWDFDDDDLVREHYPRLAAIFLD